METAQLKQQLKKQIVEFLNLLSVNPDDIKDDEPLFGEGLKGLNMNSPGCNPGKENDFLFSALQGRNIFLR